MGRIRLISLIGLISLMVAPLFAQADDFTSTNFTVKDPVIAEPASYGTSSNYGLWGTMPNIAPTVGSSTSFGVNPGFLAFSNVTMPTLSAVADTDFIDLSWTAATGATVTYEPGVATAPGGPYAFGPTQTTLTATIGSLTPSTAYYLIVRVKQQSGGALLGYSNELAISTLDEAVSDDDSPTEGEGSGFTPPPTGWVYGPSGLIPLGGSGGDGGGEMLSPGESITITPALFRQFGSVITIKGGSEVMIVGAEITLWRLNSETGVFDLWPSDELATIYTDEFGLFSFLVPIGTYQMSVKVPGYVTYTSSLMVVDATGQFEQRIELVRGALPVAPPTWLVVTVLLVAVLALVLILVILRALKRHS